MEKDQYLKILKSNLKQTAENLDLREFYSYQQDNDPKHMANGVEMVASLWWEISGTA